MALTTHQINQAYVSVFGRPAVGTEITKAAEAESVSALAASIIAAEQALAKANKPTELTDVTLFQDLDSSVVKTKVTNAEFVENLYTTFLNRGSDEEGLAYWKGVLANGATRDEVISSFKAAIIAQAAENTEDYVAYKDAVAAKVDAFLEHLYQTDAGRPADEEGKAYWASQIANGATYAQVIEAFTAALEAQGTKTEDGLAFSNKMGVADYATESLKSFSKVATADKIKEAKAQLKTQIESVSSDSDEENITPVKENIDEIANTYKTPGTKSFTTDTNDKLGIGEDGQFNTTAATNFQGTVNLDAKEKGTIQATDLVYGNTAFANGNVLTVNVTGTATNKTLALGADLPQTDGVANLVVKASTAKVEGAIDTKFTNTVTVEAGYVDNTVANDQASNIHVAGVVDTYKAGSKADTLALNAAAAKVTNIDMGAGNDTITLGAGTTAVHINGGAGKDTLELASAATPATNTFGIKDLTSIEVVKLTGVATAATSGAAIDYDAIKGNLAFSVASNANGSGDLTLKLTKANTTVDVSKIVNGVVDDKGVYQNKVATLTLDGVHKGSTIKLEGSVDGNKLIDNIVLDGDYANGGKVIITNFAIDKTTGDHIKIADVAAATAASGATTGVSGVKSANIDTKGILIASKAAAAASVDPADKVDITSVSMAQNILANTTDVKQANIAAIVQIGNDSYIIDTGADATSTADDIVIQLMGVDGSKGLDITTNMISVLNA